MVTGVYNNLMKTFIKYSFIAWIFSGCNIADNEYAAKTVFTTETLDTIQAAPATPLVSPVLFEAAFIKGTTLDFRKSIFTAYGVTIGKIKITSGYITACDPLHIDEYGIPFTQLFPKGEFPVQLAIAKLGVDETIAYARINFSDEPVAKWEFALQKGQDSIPLKGKKMHGYSVDAGMGIFIDEEAKKALDKKQVMQSDGAVYKEMAKHFHNDWRYAMYNFGNHNLATFTTGLGDGYYATYIGFDAQGKPCRLLTDFDLFKWK